MADTPKPRVGVIGLGAMGARIATRLVWEGFNPQVYDVVDIAVRLFTNDVGGMLSGSPKMMAQSSDVVITVLPSAESLNEVLFGWQALADGFARGGVVIDMGGSDATTIVAASRRLADRGIDLLDAPALGTPADARAGKLTLVVGGEETVFARCRPVLDVLATRILHAGPVGAGQAGAAIGDYLRGAQMLAAAEALRIGQALGLDGDAVVEIGETLGGIGPIMGTMLRSQVLGRRFETGLALGHVRNSVDTASEASRAHGVHAPLLAACQEAWTKAEAGIGSGADQTEIVRWLESVAVNDEQNEAPIADNA
jgi:3-hydroxyisobutyrate dehydrogenase